MISSLWKRRLCFSSSVGAAMPSARNGFVRSDGPDWPFSFVCCVA